MKKSVRTRDRILSEGLALASKEGLDGVTLGVLADRVGMSKSGLFAHFDDKDQVQIGVLEEMTRVGGRTFVEPAMRAVEGAPRLRALIERWFGWSGRAGLPGGCPVAAGMFEYDDAPGPVRDKIAAMEEEWRGLLTGLVADAVRCGDFRKSLDVAQFVWELCGIYLSHHTASRFLKQRDADKRAKTAVDALFARATATDTKKRGGPSIRRAVSK